MRITPFFTEFRFTMALKKVFYVSLIIGAYTTIPLSIHYYRELSKIEMISASTETMLGAVLSLLLVFRANRAYERWWEARSQWGTLVNVSRNLAIKIQTFVKPSKQEAEFFFSLIEEFSDSLINNLRGVEYTLRSQLIKLPPNATHLPSALCTVIYEKLEQYRHEGRISETQLLIIDTDLSRFMHVTGACEKIKNTLISLSYRSFVHHIMIILFIFLPWKLVDSYELWSIPIVVMIAYISFALEGIARNLEEPFGTSSDDVHMEDISTVIRNSAKQILLR